MLFRTRLVPAGVAVFALVVLAGCGTDPDSAPLGSPASPSLASPSQSATTATAPPTTTATATATASALPTSTLPPGVDQLVRVTIRKGTVSGVTRLVEVKKGSVVRLLVSSDVADEVHLHTYDMSVEVAAGSTAMLTFRASIAGTFEVELEKRGLRLTRFRVR